jgi:hypothetical protein
MEFEKCISLLFWPITLFIIACSAVTVGLALDKNNDHDSWIVGISFTGIAFTLIQVYISDRLMRESVKKLNESIEHADSKIADVNSAMTTADLKTAYLNSAVTNSIAEVNSAKTRIANLDDALAATDLRIAAQIMTQLTAMKQMLKLQISAFNNGDAYNNGIREKSNLLQSIEQCSSINALDALLPVIQRFLTVTRVQATNY